MIQKDSGHSKLITIYYNVFLNCYLDQLDFIFGFELLKEISTIRLHGNKLTLLKIMLVNEGNLIRIANCPVSV
jgi:hypothetical protein